MVKSAGDSSVTSKTLKAWSLSKIAAAAAHRHKDEDAKTERVMAEHQLPLPRQIELLGSVTV